MITQTQTSQSYIKLGTQNVPINLTATGIRCLSCDRYYSQSQIENHLATHVNLRFVQNNFERNAKSPRKILLEEVEDPQKTQDLWIKSYLPADLSQPQISLKKIDIPLNQNRVSSYDPLKISHIHEADATQLTIDSIEAEEQVVEAEEQLNLRQHIKLFRNNEKVEKKKIHVYMNQKTVNKNFDNHKLANKQLLRDNTTVTSDEYTVMRSYANHSQQSVSNNQAVTYHISSTLKLPRNNPRISTASRRIFQTKDPKLILDASRSTVVGSRYNHDNTVTHNHNHNHECPCCSGFYCSYCKSSVPPIYRPVPDNEGNYHFHPNQNEKAVQFYRSQYYPRQDINICTSCDQRMVQGRMLDFRQEQRQI